MSYSKWRPFVPTSFFQLNVFFLGDTRDRSYKSLRRYCKRKDHEEGTARVSIIDMDIFFNRWDPNLSILLNMSNMWPWYITYFCQMELVLNRDSFFHRSTQIVCFTFLNIQCVGVKTLSKSSQKTPHRKFLKKSLHTTTNTQLHAKLWNVIYVSVYRWDFSKSLIHKNCRHY